MVIHEDSQKVETPKHGFLGEGVSLGRVPGSGNKTVLRMGESMLSCKP